MTVAIELQEMVEALTRIGLSLWLVLLSACIYVPPVWDAGDAIYLLDFIEVGVTTKEEIVARLGDPDFVYEEDDGSRFTYDGYKSGGFFVIIYVPPIPGEADPSHWQVHIDFDEDDVVRAVRTESWPAPGFLDQSTSTGDLTTGDAATGDIIEAKRRMNFERQLKMACAGARPAQYLVAQYYDRGEGVERDRIQAFKWYSLAEPAWPEAIQHFKDKLGKQMTLSEIAEAERLAREWKPDQAGCETRDVESPG